MPDRRGQYKAASRRRAAVRPASRPEPPRLLPRQGRAPGKSPACSTARRPTANGLRSQEGEHCGPKRGDGAYWGYKWEAKKESNRIRRAVLVGQQSAATEGAAQSVKTIRSVVKVINGALTSVLKKNAPLKANWVATKRIQATVVTPLPGGNAGSPNTPQSPAPVQPAA